MSRYPQVPLGEVLTAAPDEVVVESDETYRVAGIYSFSRGLFARPTIQGTDTKYKTLFRLHEGQFVYSRLKAFEGAVAVVDSQFENAFVSQEFPQFDAVRERVDPTFLGWICAWPAFWEKLRHVSEGIGARRERVRSNRLLAIQIPLPPLARQREIAAVLSELDRSARESTVLSRRAHHLIDSWADAEIGEILRVPGSARQVHLADVATVNPPKLDQGDVDLDRPVSFVPMAAVDEDTGEITRSETRPFREAEGYKSFRKGDVLFARITPCMQNGKSAVARTLISGMGFGSTEFHVIRTGGSVLPEWIHAILRTRTVRDEAARHFTGTAGQQRVPARFLEGLEIPLPTLADQERLLVRVREVQETTRRVIGHHSELERGFQRLIPSALEAALI